MIKPLTLAALMLSAGFALAAEPLRIVTLGDSITKGVRLGVAAEQTFASLIQARLIQKGIQAEVINVGIGGERTDMATKRLLRDVIDKKPQIVTIMYGTNDSYVDPGKTESRISLDEYRKQLNAIVTELKRAKIQPILMTSPSWANGVGKNGQMQGPNIKLAEYMDVCRKVAKDEKVTACGSPGALGFRGQKEHGADGMDHRWLPSESQRPRSAD